MRLLSAARTGPNHLIRFGAEASALDGRGRRDAAAVAVRLGVDTLVVRGPETSVGETTELAGLDSRPDDALRSLDVGSWTGRAPEDIPADALRMFFTDVTAAPHGGESVAAFVDRVGTWIGSLPAGTDHLLVTAKPVVQAALAHAHPLGAGAFWSIEVRPATTYVLDTGSSRPDAVDV